jgi:hypothetical protein
MPKTTKAKIWPLRTLGVKNPMHDAQIQRIDNEIFNLQSENTNLQVH